MQIRTLAVVVMSLFVVFCFGAAFAANEPETEHLENEVELEHGIEVEHCPGGGNVFVGDVAIAPPTATNTGSFNIDVRNDDCVPEVENEVENKHVNEVVHNSGHFELNADDSITLSNMTTTRPNTTVTSAAGDNFTVSCTQTTNGNFDVKNGVLDGTISMTCTGTGKMKKQFDDLFLEKFPNF